MSVDSAGRMKPMEDVDFAAGSKRYRPSIEDVIETVIDEGFTHPLPYWDQPLRLSRERYEQIQLRAAVATHPDGRDRQAG